MLLGRLTNSPDIERNGFLIDGFPRTASQVFAVMEDPQWAALRPDCVISLNRPEELRGVRTPTPTLALALLTRDPNPNRHPNPNPTAPPSP